VKFSVKLTAGEIKQKNFTIRNKYFLFFIAVRTECQEQFLLYKKGENLFNSNSNARE